MQETKRTGAKEEKTYTHKQRGIKEGEKREKKKRDLQINQIKNPVSYYKTDAVCCQGTREGNAPLLVV